MPQQTKQLLALDIGDKRVGVALASLEARLASPLVTLSNDDSLTLELQKLIQAHNIETIVVGLPRTLSGQDSSQTTKVRQLIEQLSSQLDVGIITQDEALSSVRAEEELNRRGKIFAKMDIDKLAAALILEDYIAGLKT